MDALNRRLLGEQLASPHREFYARAARAWAASVGERVAAVAGSAPADTAARLHELRSLSNVAGARGLAEAAAGLEQRVERGERVGPGDVAALAGLAERAAADVTRWWEGHGAG